MFRWLFEGQPQPESIPNQSANAYNSLLKITSINAIFCFVITENKEILLSLLLHIQCENN